ncbi:MAG: hypothetical protein WC145_06460 [Aliarcobacter sp.]|jgi:hypothetical protein
MISIEAYRELIRRMGEQFRWLRAMPSDAYDPRLGLDGDREDIHSDHGHIYVDEGLRRGLLAQQKRDALHPELGWIHVGQLWLTVMPDEVRLAPWDKVVLVERTQIEMERIARGTDQLGQRYPVRILSVADSAAEYTEDVHWRLDLATRKIIWLTDGPEPGSIYGVRYEYRPVYWFLGGDYRSPRPVPGTEGYTPVRGLLSIAPPEA